MQQDSRRQRLVLRKVEIPPLKITKRVTKVVPDVRVTPRITLVKPEIEAKKGAKRTYSLNEKAQKRSILVESRPEEEFLLSEEFEDVCAVAADFSRTYRIDLKEIYGALKDAYVDDEVSISHLIELRKQIERQVQNYKITQEEIEESLALLKLEGFEKEVRDTQILYTTEILCRKDREELLLNYEDFKQLNQRDFSFHYTPYNMDSRPERAFFQQMLETLNEDPDAVADIYFMGAVTDPKKTDFMFPYEDKQGKMRSYTPDFLIRKKNGKVLIVEIKGDIFRDIRKEYAMEGLVDLNPEQLEFKLLPTQGAGVRFADFAAVKRWVYSSK